TLPDLIAGDKAPAWGALVLVNASEKPIDNLSLLVTPTGSDPVSTALPLTQPLSVRKVGFLIPPTARKAGETVALELRLQRGHAPRPWAHSVAPTNRRPFGFGWEDWGRLDALEVLELAQKSLRNGQLRTYLTGHSMGGHGTWHLGATFPDRWAASAPSAGWID